MSTKVSQVNHPKKWWWVLAGASIAGLAASFIQTVERINFAKDPQVPLQCDLNAIFSCSNVFDAWQSSVFGVSNSMISLVFFAFVAGVAISGATGAMVNIKFRYVLHFLALFFLGFGAWYLWQSAYKIGYLCIFCTVNYAAVVVINWAMLRLNGDALFSSASANAKWQSAKKSGLDTFIWIVWAVLISAMIALHFW